MIEAMYSAPQELDRFGRRALGAGILLLAACAVGWLISPEQFFRSYLLGYVFWIGITLGCLAIVMLHHLSGGAWGIVIRRLLESATSTLPLMAILFLPLAFGTHVLYEWARPEAVSGSPVLQHKSIWLNLPFYLGRAFFYFGVWWALSYFLNKWSSDQDGAAQGQHARRLEALSAPGLILFGLTVTFASIDWVMSLEPEWYSTIFGILFMGGQVLSALSFVIAAAVLLGNRKPLSDAISPSHLHDLGKLLLAFVMLWAYFAFSQYLIIWAGNLPEEITWYVTRLHGGWQWIGLLLVLFHFALPFVLLLSRDLKRSGRLLARLAVVVIAMRFIDLFWLIAPEFHKEALSLHWMDLAAPAGLGGIWLAFFVRRLKDKPLLPIGDPNLAEALSHGQH